MGPWSPALADAEPRTAALSLDEWIVLPEDAPGEFVDGYLAEEEVPDPIHELAVSWLIALFRAWLGQGRGFVFGSDVKLVVSPTRGRKPDLSVFLPGRSSPPRRGPIAEPPDLVVEVVSPSPADERRDRVSKMEEYAAFGVRYYWLLDPALGSLEMFELHSGRYTRVLAAVDGTMADVPGCPGLALSLDDLWTELKRLDAQDQP